MNKLICLFLCAALTACSDPKPTLNLKTPGPLAGNGDRFSIERAGVFEDALAYGGTRGIYLLHDNRTERDYVGVSGVGIAEVGTHPVGKAQVADER